MMESSSKTALEAQTEVLTDAVQRLLVLHPHVEFFGEPLHEQLSVLLDLVETNYAKLPQPEPEPVACEYCDGTGDVHDQTGEWRGRCTCAAGRAQPQSEAQPCPHGCTTQAEHDAHQPQAEAISQTVPDNDCVICPKCAHQFRAISVNDQKARKCVRCDEHATLCTPCAHAMYAAQPQLAAARGAKWRT